MNVIQIVFSPTGGTQKVADTITGEWGTACQKIDLTDAAADHAAVQLTKEDLILIAIPSFGGRVPALAAQRLSQINGNDAQCVIVCVYGNRAYEDTLIELNDIAGGNGFQVIAAVSAIAEHSIMRQYAAGRPDSQDQKQLCGFAKKIWEKANAPGQPKNVLSLPGNRPYKKAGGAGIVPKANSACTGCGLCADHCPAQAISKTALKTADKAKCISCMRCVAQCPGSARHVNGVLVSIAAQAIKKACSVKKENELFI